MKQAEEGAPGTAGCGAALALSPAIIRTMWFGYKILWAGALILALVALYYGYTNFLSIYTGTHDSLLPLAVDRWIRLAVFLAPPAAAAAVATFLLRARSGNGVTALLSLSLLLISATSGIAGDFWIWADRVALGTVIGDIGWLGLILSLLVFPTGTFAFKWVRAAAIAIFAVQAWMTYRQIAGHACALPCSMLPAGASVRPLVYYVPYFVLIGFLAVCAAALAHRRECCPDAKERRHIGWTLTGVLPAALLVALYVYLNTTGEGRWGAIAISFAQVSLTAGILVALLRHQLYDSDLIASRSAAYAVLTVAAAAVFVGGEALITTSLRAGTASEPAEKTLVALVALGVVAPLRSAVMDWADRQFRQPLTQLRDGLPASLAQLRDLASIDELIEESAERTRRALRPAQLAFVLDGQVWPRSAAARAQVENWLELVGLDQTARSLQCVRSDPEFPIRLPLRVAAGSERPPIGWLLLGPRPDGSLYNREEESALSHVAAPIARAIRAAQLRDEPLGPASSAAARPAPARSKGAAHERTRRPARP